MYIEVRQYRFLTITERPFGVVYYMAQGYKQNVTQVSYNIIFYERVIYTHATHCIIIIIYPIPRVIWKKNILYFRLYRDFFIIIIAHYIYTSPGMIDIRFIAGVLYNIDHFGSSPTPPFSVVFLHFRSYIRRV